MLRNRRAPQTLVGNGFGGIKESDDDLRQQYIDCSGCACLTIVIFALVASAAVVVGAVSLSYATRDSQSTVHIKSGEIPSSPYGNHLNGGGAPLAMTLPNDLTPYVGLTLHVYALDAQPHTITISSGPLTTTWDGVNTVATLGGAAGDGLTFRVLSKTDITVLFTKNVVFS